MGLPRLEKCCCFDLKTGNMILGSINAWFSFILFAAMILAATEVDTIERGTEMIQDEEMEMSPSPDTIVAEAVSSGVILLIILFLAKFLFDIFFLYGVVKERRGIIKAYFIMWAVFFSISVFTFFLNIYRFGLKTIIFELVYIGVNGYAMLLSNSLYEQLGTREEI